MCTDDYAFASEVVSSVSGNDTPLQDGFGIGTVRASRDGGAARPLRQP